MNVNGDIVDGGSNGEVLRDGVIGEEGVGWEMDEDDGMMNDGDKSSTTCVTMTVLADSCVCSLGMICLVGLWLIQVFIPVYML